MTMTMTIPQMVSHRAPKTPYYSKPRCCGCRFSSRLLCHDVPARGEHALSVHFKERLFVQAEAVHEYAEMVRQHFDRSEDLYSKGQDVEEHRFLFDEGVLVPSKALVIVEQDFETTLLDCSFPRVGVPEAAEASDLSSL